MSNSFSFLRSLACASFLGLSSLVVGCSDGSTESDDADITDVQHTDVERQSIGNCWIYAEATWVESMHLAGTGEKFDVSQSYWTYWHWFDQITEEGPDEIQTGGFFEEANRIALRRGLMPEGKFLPEDTTSEMSSAQDRALDKINEELKNGRLKDIASRNDGVLVRKVLDEAWGLSSSIRGQLTRVFGKDGKRTLTDTASTKFTSIVAANKFKVQYTDATSGESVVKDTTLDEAINDWHNVFYPSFEDEGSANSQKRKFLIRLQRALHDRQPVIITWDVDFNAMSNFSSELPGAFTLKNLKATGSPGHQGGHMTVLEDYQATTEEFGVLEAGVTLDPSKPEDKAKLDAALLPTTKIDFLRIKNSWGSLRDDRTTVPGFPGYHDLHMDYLNGPIAWCPNNEHPTNENCFGTTTPFQAIVLPPGY